MKIEYQLLYNEIDSILWEEWDPIGVNMFPSARDEYQSYARNIYLMRINECSIRDMQQYLFEVVRYTMNIDIEKNDVHCKKIAEKLVALPKNKCNFISTL